MASADKAHYRDGRRPLTRARSQWRHDAERDHFICGVPVTVWRRNVGDGLLTCLVGDEPTGWHLSISFTDNRGHQSRYPSWDEIADARYRLLPDDVDFVMHLPPPSEYVAVHDTTFHLHEHPERGGEQ
jgi:hypothetical protein